MAEPVGKPLKYKTVEELQSIIDEYFDKDTGEAYLGEGDDRRYLPTMAGLAYKLGLSRQGLLNYSNRDEYVDAIKDARTLIEISLEQRLAGNAVTGTIFNLKNNFAWKDKTETEFSGGIDLSGKSDAELAAIIEK